LLILAPGTKTLKAWKGRGIDVQPRTAASSPHAVNGRDVLIVPFHGTEGRQQANCDAEECLKNRARSARVVECGIVEQLLARIENGEEISLETLDRPEQEAGSNGVAPPSPAQA
jgi:hypothetical protein